MDTNGTYLEVFCVVPDPDTEVCGHRRHHLQIFQPQVHSNKEFKKLLLKDHLVILVMFKIVQRVSL